MKTVVISALVLIALLSSISLVSAQIDTNSSIPEWVKSVASWWSDGKISDSEYINATEFLVDNGIIQIPKIQTMQKQIDDLQAQVVSLKSQLNNTQQTKIIQTPVIETPQINNSD